MTEEPEMNPKLEELAEQKNAILGIYINDLKKLYTDEVVPEDFEIHAQKLEKIAPFFEMEGETELYEKVVESGLFLAKYYKALQKLNDKELDEDGKNTYEKTVESLKDKVPEHERIIEDFLNDLSDITA